ncbi:hypothetical protein D3C73_625650 [compost metagenome]
MVDARIIFNKTPIPVTLIGTDQKLIPSLIQALKNNKLTLFNFKFPLERIELFSAEAFIYSTDGLKARIPIF